MKGKMKYLLTFLFSAILVFSLVACGGGEDVNSANEPQSVKESVESTPTSEFEEPDTPKIFVSTVVTVYLHEDVVLKVNDGFDPESMQWLSADTSIATVNKGVVTTKKVGMVKIAVKSGDIEDELTLKINEPQDLPLIVTNEPDGGVTLYRGMNFPVQLAVYYCGAEYADFTARYASDRPIVATVDDQGKIRAVSVGETIVTITISWRELSLETAVSVKVISDEYIDFFDENGDKKDGSDIYLKDGYKTTDKVIPKLFDAEGEIDNVSFTVREVAEDSDKGKIATCTDGGIITATGVGTTYFEFVCNYNDFDYVSDRFRVTVQSVLIDLDDSLYAEYDANGNGYVVNVNSAITADSIYAVEVDGKAAQAAGATFTADKALAKGAHNVIFSVTGDEGAEYACKLFIADKVIYNTTDLCTLRIERGAYNVLANDIDCNGATLTLGDLGEFNGILDGNGYEIKNVKNGNIWSGIFATIGVEGLIKDIGFTNINTTQTSNAFALVGSLKGTLQNVSVVTGNGGSFVAIINKVYNNCVLQNVVVYGENVTVGIYNSGKHNTETPALPDTLPSDFVHENVFAFIAGANENNTKMATCFVLGDGDYRNTDRYKNINFAEIFGDGTGVWKTNAKLAIPVVRKALGEYVYAEDAYVYEDEDLAVNLPFAEVSSVKIGGEQLGAEYYAASGNTVVINKNYIADIKPWSSEVEITSADKKVIYVITLEKHTAVSNLAELRAIKDNPEGYYILTSDIDCLDGDLSLGNFSGVFDGNGHTVYNVKLADANWSAIFGIITADAAVRNVGFYNVNSAATTDKSNFVFAREIHGTIENVSVHTGGTGKFHSVIQIVSATAKISEFVTYATNVNTKGSGFASSPAVRIVNGVSVKNFAATNIYVFANAINDNSKVVATYFATGESGTDYKSTAAFTAIDFTTIFDCGENGIWEISSYEIPLVKVPECMLTFEISDLAGLKAISEKPSAHYVLTADINCANSPLTLGEFNGVLDGNGYQIKNVVTASPYSMIFTKVNAGAVIKNVGFYGIGGTYLIGELYGTLENVSFKQNASGIIAPIQSTKLGCRVVNFVSYCNNVLTGGNGFAQSSAKANFTGGLANVYVVANESNGNAPGFVTGYFDTATYTTDAAFTAIDFTAKFNCSATGLWKMDATLGLPLIKKA